MWLTGYLGTPGLSAGGTISGDLTVTGNLTVQGITTSVVNQTTTGTVVVDVDATGAFIVRKADDTQILRVDTVNSQVNFAAGSAAVPSIMSAVSANTGIYFSGATVNVSVAAANKLTVDANGVTATVLITAALKAAAAGDVSLAIDAAGTGQITLGTNSTGNINFQRVSVFGANVSHADGTDVAFGTTTGTKIGTATTQKIGFYNATPVVQATGIADADGTLADITTKFNSLLGKLETYGLLAAA